MKLSKLEKMWEQMDDKGRVLFLIEKKKKIPLYVIEVDNDSVFLSFDEEYDKDDPIVLSFDGFGDELLVSTLQAISLPADFC